MNKIDNTRLGTIEGVLSIVINTILAALKFWIGSTTGSVAIVADAWHTLSDSLTSAIVILGFKISSRPPDREHPFGHGRAEIIGSVMIGTLLGIVGLSFLIESFQRLSNHQSADYCGPAFVVFVISVILKEGMARFSIRAGKKINSRSLIADGWHHRSDAVASFLILVGIYMGQNYWWMDAMVGGAVSLIILSATYSIMKGSISSLIGETPATDLSDSVNAIIREIVGGDIAVHHIHFHCYGSHSELTFHITLPGEMRLTDAHGLSDCIENAIRDQLGIESTIHLDPE